MTHAINDGKITFTLSAEEATTLHLLLRDGSLKEDATPAQDRHLNALIAATSDFMVEIWRKANDVEVHTKEGEFAEMEESE